MLITSYDAANYIKSHDHEVFTTPDGLVAKTWAATSAPKADTWEEFKAIDFGDIYFEELQAFPIDKDGMVDLKPIKAWLGY